MTTETVSDRIAHANDALSPERVALATLFVAALSFSLLFLQEPAVHDSLHGFRHAAGVVCH